MIEKSKGGRPALSDEPTVKMEITLPPHLRDKLDRITMNRSAWVRQAIEAAKEPPMSIEQQARQRVSKTPELDAVSETIFYDWPNWTEHKED